MTATDKALRPSDAHFVRGNFGLPKRAPRRRDSILGASAPWGVGLLVALVLCQWTAQWLARELAYQSALGRPYLTPLGALYPFWHLPVWLRDLAGYASAHALVRNAFARIGLSLAAGALAAAALAHRARKAAANRATDLHGSARFATREDVEGAGLFAQEGVVLGQWREGGRLRWLRSDTLEHVLLLGPPGSGKGVGPIVSTLLTWKGSLIVLDPKGENHALTSGYRATFSDVFLLDFSAVPEETAAWNPLDEIRVRTAFEIADAQRVALQLVAGDNDGPKSEATQYFIDTATTLLTAAILHALYARPAGSPAPCLADVDAAITDPGRADDEVFEAWLDACHDPALSQKWADEEGRATPTHPFVAKAAREHLNRDPKDRSPIQSTVVSKLALFRDPLLAHNTASSDFDLLSLVGSTRPVTVYLRLRIADLERRTLEHELLRFRTAGTQAPARPRRVPQAPGTYPRRQAHRRSGRYVGLRLRRAGHLRQAALVLQGG